MNLSPCLPKTPVRTPQTGTSNKTIQLTPIWEAVVKSHRIPSEVNENSVFQEISSRLGDLEWPVRQHAFRVLYDVIPTISKDRLDERIIQNDILHKLTINLGHPAPGVRKVAMETIRQYLKQTLYSEKMLESFVLNGVKEEEMAESDVGIIRENVILGTIMSLVDILKPFIFPENGGYAISQSFLNKIVAILSEKMKSPLYQEKCAETLWKIRDMVGENRFLRCLDHLPDKTILDLIRLRDLHEKLSMYQNANGINGEKCDSDKSFDKEPENSITTYHNYKMIGKNGNTNQTDWLINEKLGSYKTLEESTEEYSDGTDTDTYTKETISENEIKFLTQIQQETKTSKQPSFTKTSSTFPVLEKDDLISTDKSSTKETDSKKTETLRISDDNTSDSASSSPRVVLETEIQFSEDKAIKMTIVEDEKTSAIKDNEIDLFPVETKSSRESSAERRFVTEDGDLIMKILHNNENEEYQDEERKRTPRRVRFGGEVIKLRTPDSDETDNNAEVRETENTEQQETGNRPLTSHGRQDTRSKPEIKVTPVKNDSPKKKPDKLVPKEEKITTQSHIPIPVSPATKSPLSREASPAKRTNPENVRSPGTGKTKVPDKHMSKCTICPQSTTEDEQDESTEDEQYSWKWSELGLINERLIADLKNQNDWKIRYQALEEVKVTLINPKVIDRLGKVADDVKLSSLIKCLLYKLPQSNNQQVTTLAISVVFQLIQTLPKEAIKRNLQDIVKGLCKYVGGCKNVNLKIESVQSLKMLFGLLEPSSVTDILLDHCLTSSSSKMRENALLAIMYATMTFPSTMFDIENVLEKVAKAAADSRRRVRHAALEAIAILSQFCSSETLTECVSRSAEILPCNIAKSGLISAVQARLSRRVLPTVSNEGLVLYSLQIPASRRFGSVGNPSGADVSWILSGTGSVSTGSARSRGQLNAAQRLELSPKKWRNNNQQQNQIFPSQSKFTNLSNNVLDKSNKKSEDENPWTKQKNRTELIGSRQTTQENWKNHGNKVYRTPSVGNLTSKNREKLKFTSSDNLLEDNPRISRIYPAEVMERDGGFGPENVSWALVPVSSLEEQQLARIRNHQLWGEFGIENGTQYITSPVGPLRPLYLKLQPTPDHLSLSRSTDDVRRSSFSYGPHRGSERTINEDFTQIRVLTPSALREKKIRNEGLDTEPNSARATRNELVDNSKIPVLHTTTTNHNTQKPQKSNTDLHNNEKKLLEDNLGKQNTSVIKNGGLESSPIQGPLFPNIHSQANGNVNHDFVYHPQKPSHTQYSEINENKIQETVTQLDGLYPTTKGYSKPSLTNRSPDTQTFASGKTHLIENETILPVRNKKTNDFNSSFQNGHAKLYDAKTSPSQNGLASSPNVVNGSARDQTPSTSSSNSTDYGVMNGDGIRLKRLKNGTGALENNKKILSISNNERLKANRVAISKNKVNHNGSPFPDNLKPFDKPKEGLETCSSQLDSQQWEVVMLGLTSLVRLLRHHPAIVMSQIHPIIMALGRQIRNLRSQVARAACQAAAEMFVVLKRNIEIDLEELAGPLFHRCADTNRFIRLDCGQALDNMADNVSPAKAINVIISKGSTHQNAVVRTVAARLLLRLSEKIGPEKILSLPRDIRDKVVQTGANLLMEGKLETRAFAKELFRVWSSHPSFSNLILEAIPPNIMRHISKTLISLKT